MREKEAGSAEDDRPRAERYRRLVEGIPGVVFFEHGPDHRFTYLSPGAKEVYGYEPEELVGRPFEILHPGDPSDETVHELTRLAFEESRTASGYTAVNRRKDGRIIFVEIVETPVVVDGEVVSVQGIARDVTDRVGAHRSLRESEVRLRDSTKNEAIRRLAGGIAHEYNNLLTAITGNVDFLAEELPGDDPRLAYLDAIRKASERGRVLTRRLLELGRGHISLPQTLDLNELVGEAEDLLTQVLGEDIHLVKDLDPDLAPVEADPARIEQVLVDLALNARDAMPEGGTLTIETRNVTFGAREGPVEMGSGHYACITVRDTGEGIPREIQDRVFDPFFTTKGPALGGGLGLATVYGIARQAGGSADVESLPGQGAAISVYLPAMEKGTERHDGSGPLLPAPYAAETGVILLVDGSGDRSVRTRVLEAGGHTVLEARDADEANQRFEEEGSQLDLLISRTAIAGRSGLTLAATLRARRPDLAVLLLAEPTDQGMAVEHALHQGIRFLPLPVIPGELLRTVDQMLVAKRGA